MKEEIIYSAIEAMKEQDALLDSEVRSINPKIIMSVETFEQIQKNPEIAQSIYNRITKTQTHEERVIDDIGNFLKKW